ncbi:hypothetical protein A3A64_04545 [Candidatus Gottesmanbacteria bacterium RIFCSPLOWO2_01_FULL_48_11]|uniref:Uncharacterized protein n=1 Tax=Candidatus Gottesmanbacteria bacterium RIFCSPLOWO2_01_FULL_48_11 TaxID=1798395 RepID=A0A1F6ASJ1_9BACT|nr:MAG: hypothetical protein UX77_C0001G0016 [Parcubacteria group bacterium GW2011_GWA1_47_11]OGG27628.1 MAG: hypothetical protein A3A64_04545 [Candidatus Gottesmanbacteria bacterium RIFCSPLOWO2_01_FULL_48_11]
MKNCHNYVYKSNIIYAYRYRICRILPLTRDPISDILKESKKTLYMKNNIDNFRSNKVDKNQFD